MEISVSIPLDADGFLRRECPSCEREFKWHNGPTGEAPADQPPATEYFCPLCGKPSGTDTWWTPAQLEYARESAAGPIMDELLGGFERSLRNNKFVKMTSSRGSASSPASLHEPDDMSIIQSPCHPWEPVKVSDDSTAPYFCLVCGTEYAV
jgi:hypothetical protein